MKKTINALVLTGYGLNCDHETAYALALAGANAVRVHINQLIDGSVQLDSFQIMVFVGGFSWGDDHGAGVVQAIRLKTRMGDSLLRFISDGKLILGICNGFQTLVNMGLLPGIHRDYQSRCVALTYNDCGNFRDDWVCLNVNPHSPCIFTKGIDPIELPIRHGQGKFYASDAILEQLSQKHLTTLFYAMPSGDRAQGRFPFNPNGSLHDIAGICDETGRIFGLMPHPEAYLFQTNHPNWTEMKENLKRQGKPFDVFAPARGIQIFQNAVDFFK